MVHFTYNKLVYLRMGTFLRLKIWKTTWMGKYKKLKTFLYKKTNGYKLILILLFIMEMFWIEN